MKTRFFYKLVPYALIMYSELALAVLPMTTTYNSGTTNFARNTSGTANYIVSIGGIIPSNTPITFNFNPNGSNGLTAAQVSTGGSLCSGVSTVCSNNTFSLSTHQSCCLELALTSHRTGDDTTTTTASIAGKTAARYDTYFGSGSFGDPNWGGWGIDVGSSTWDTASSGANNGGAVPGYIGNTATITDALGCTPSTSPSYAACLCTNLSIDAEGYPCTSPDMCYTNWYLPAICELAPFGSICTVGSTNMQEQLYNAVPPIIANFTDSNFYWSSTEYSADPNELAFFEYFVSSGSSAGAEDKRYSYNVRCSRTF